MDACLLVIPPCYSEQSNESSLVIFVIMSSIICGCVRFGQGENLILHIPIKTAHQSTIGRASFILQFHGILNRKEDSSLKSLSLVHNFQKEWSGMQFFLLEPGHLIFAQDCVYLHIWLLSARELGSFFFSVLIIGYCFCDSSLLIVLISPKVNLKSFKLWCFIVMMISSWICWSVMCLNESLWQHFPAVSLCNCIMLIFCPCF